MKILYVDDDFMLGVSVLRRAGHEVHHVFDGDSALAAYRESGPYDLVLTDEMHPGLPGTELAKAIRAIDRHQPIGFLTTCDSAGYPRMSKFFAREYLVGFAEATAHLPSHRRPAR